MALSVNPPMQVVQKVKRELGDTLWHVVRIPTPKVEHDPGYGRYKIDIHPEIITWLDDPARPGQYSWWEEAEDDIALGAESNSTWASMASGPGDVVFVFTNAQTALEFKLRWA
ncbi:MAG: hypothetical protein EOP83_09980 [Verrucomicrobiaceae bacterium]|nr:MAG: hypothetical protein EOP83_09980 [Verrucomicrobiaceae bacterium]